MINIISLLSLSTPYATIPKCLFLNMVDSF